MLLYFITRDYILLIFVILDSFINKVNISTTISTMYIEAHMYAHIKFL